MKQNLPGLIGGLLVLLSLSGCATTPNEKLMNAIHGEDYEDFKAAIAEGADINAIAPDGNTGRLYYYKNKSPLTYAASVARLSMMKDLIARGANVKQMDNEGQTALLSSQKTFSEWPECVKYLIDAGSDVNAKDADGRWTPLTLAAWGYANKARPETVKLLLSSGADPSIKGPGGRTAREIAIERGFHDVAKIIADYEQKQQQQISSQQQLVEQKRFLTRTSNELVALKNKQACKLQDVDWAYLGTSCQGGFAHGKGKAENPGAELIFEGSFANGKRTEGVVYHQGLPMYDGKIVEGKPDGNGICYHKGEPEECRYYKGKRVDGLYKQRMELAVQQQYLEMLKTEMDKLKQQQLVAVQNGQASVSNDIGDSMKKALMDKAAEKVVDKIFDRLF